MHLNSVHSRRSKTTGVTLVELLVGLAVGAIVLIGVLFSWGLTVRNNAYVLGVTALNNDMRSLMAITTQDLRRASQDPGRVWRTADGQTMVIDGSCVVFNPFFTRADDPAALPVTVASGYRLNNGDFQFWIGATPPVLNDLDTRCAGDRWETILESGDRGIQLTGFEVEVDPEDSYCLAIASEGSWADSGTPGPCPADATESLELALLEVTLSGTLESSGVTRDFAFIDKVQLRNYRVIEE